MSSKYEKCAKAEQLLYNNEEIRIVMVGKTGAGKSATANTILGEKKFKSRFSLKSVTEKCAKAGGQVDGQKVSVIDTPGLFDTKIDQETTCRNIIQCLTYASPGPQIFLIIIRLGRFTEEEKKTVQKIQKIFGEEADKYSMVLFTHGDQLGGEPFEEFLGESEDLQELVAKCNGQYHVFDNNQKDRAQVTELLRKIRNITKKNGGSHYTTEMFQEAERLIEEKKQQILKEEEEQRKKEQMELEKKIERKYEQELKEAKDDLEKERKLRAFEKEKERERAELLEQQEAEARRKAEESSSVLDKIGRFFKGVVKAVEEVAEAVAAGVAKGVAKGVAALAEGRAASFLKDM